VERLNRQAEMNGGRQECLGWDRRGNRWEGGGGGRVVLLVREGRGERRPLSPLSWGAPLNFLLNHPPLNHPS
jgi:hypothetical protein